uniref:Uncharacterized protein n=1 Tax=Anopheles coluzzii TaxID=1518534 RepID=A0A6E8W0M3_ANOCL|nr:uncharacterized protein LOC120958899 [Anopheles coluzzii]
MASARAFGILNNQNQANGNHHFVGKNLSSLKGSDSRSSSAFALKDLTNNKGQQRTVVHQDGKGKSIIGSQGKQLKASANSIMHKIGLTNEKAAPARKPSNSAAAFDTFSPQYAEYGWEQSNCLRNDLLEQMIDFTGVSCAIKRKPLPPITPGPLDLPDLDDVSWNEDNFRPLNDQRFSSVKPLDLPADDFPLVDIQDLEFMF